MTGTDYFRIFDGRRGTMGRAVHATGHRFARPWRHRPAQNAVDAFSGGDFLSTFTPLAR